MHVKTIFNRRYGHLFTFELNKTTFSLIVLLLIGILAGASPRAAAPPPPLPTIETTAGRLWSAGAVR